MSIPFKSRKAEPPMAKRGKIARIYLYMEDRYPFRLSDGQRKLYEAWNCLYPATIWEIERNEEISRVQGWDNPYVSGHAEG